MANYAKIENGVVTEILVVPDAYANDGNAYLNSIGLDGQWVIATSNKEAVIGDTYVSSTGNFKPAKPFASWKWNSTEYAWFPPKDMPTDGKGYRWNEQLVDWVEI